jgi:small subunit ribosomal protein S1
VRSIRDNQIIVEFNAKEQGVCPLAQFEKAPRIGERHEFVVDGLEPDGLLRLSRPGATAKADWNSLQQDMIVEAMVVGMNTGGLDLKIANQRAFMPVSQIEMHRVEDLTPYLNRKLRCQVVELNKRKRRIVLSRRAVLEVEAAEIRKKLLETLQPNQVVEGTIRSIQKFGAFVSLADGLDGLVHVSDLSWTHVDDPAQVVKIGQKVSVVILKIDGERIGLGLKQTTPDPWDTVETQYPVGGVVAGKVTRVAEFGAFIEIAPAIEGMVHVSQISHDRIKSPSSVLAVGQDVQAKIIQVERNRRRISLSIKALTVKEGEAAPTVNSEKASRDDINKYLRKDEKSRAMESLMAKFGSGGLKGGIG